MNNNAQSILRAALGLTVHDRTFLVARLLQSLPPNVGQLSEEELYGELEKRSADFDQGTANAVPWSELRKEL
jgi:putative addiction module component (TIGR02574 family)